ncbi:sulfite reductase (NADPH) flavoprotein alpha-component [Granulicella rosea]|uniref:assimilatory sulfite reductase (NADPH) n=1 Tax=Granulicella rosea TaxID=474952 RepID=A0A239EMU9_9BACT|nr:sulfite reductase subunit alpha [Granulicella rosea]SNS45363.1 sulfite reductase (NADPH) flavoprotein alpha-component [Granulicella rosea]
MSTTVPFIPESAPFTPEQRGWLNGFLAGLLSGAPAPVAASGITSLKVAVLYASQSGVAEGLARKVAKELKAKGHAPSLASLEAFEPAALAAEEHAVIVASTYGEGDPPDSAKSFYGRLCMDDAPRLEGLNYSVLALGDKHYEQFCKFGIDLDARLQSLGAKPIRERVDSDVDTDEPFAHWKSELLARLDALAGGVAAAPATPVASKTDAVPERAQVHTRETPYLAPLVEKYALNKGDSSKQTLHLAWSLAGSEVFYEAGDALGVVAQNDPCLVSDILDAMKLSGEEHVEIGATKTSHTGFMPLREALTHHLQISRLNRRMVELFANEGRIVRLLDLLKSERQTELDAYLWDRGPIDLLTEYPGVLHVAQELVAMLPRLTPRLYSISSSPAAHTAEVHATVAVVRYRSHNRDRGGVCSTMFADRTSAGDRLPVYIQPNKRFRLPRRQDAPVIMIGPGTGIAPFRGFLHERRAVGATGKNWLFFGDRSAATDFLYEDELTAMRKDGHLTRLDLAFSRDQERKIYVQDRMLEQAPMFWQWLEEGASIYVCGDASRMAKDVDATLHAILQQQGRLDAEGAREYVDAIKEQQRYHRDVY